MYDAPPLAITGATGSIGGLVAADLAGAGHELRLLARTPSKLPELPGAVPAQMSYGDRESLLAALAGVKTLFMVSAAEAADRLDQHYTFVDAAAESGVQHIVYTSFFTAAPDSTFTLGRDHAATEDRIKASGMSYTFLRDNFYLDFLAHLPGTDGVIRGPAEAGRVAAVARADVARCAVSVLASPDSHRDATYPLTGPESLTMTEIAAILSDHLGRSISYHNETIDEAYESRRAWPAPQWQYDAWVSTYTAIANGELDGTTDAVHELTGRAPLSLLDVLTQG